MITLNVTSAETETNKIDRETVCSKEFGRYKNGVYEGSTPMQQACRTRNRISRILICKQNYDKPEIINACIATYDAIAYRAEKIQAS